ncbi:MAG: DUF1275 domain-containing protein [Mycobacteriaceae bacterium]|nr:DUF1275 domain-containing protein [Mycobacteriaceae bacterium]
MIRTSTTLRFALLLTAANGFLDSYTYLARGGVFANVQTGNVIFAAIDLAHWHWGNTLAHLWPILAFLAGVTLASHIKSGRVHKVIGHPLRWTMAVQASVLAVMGFVPASVPHSFVNVPISFVSAMQMGLFRSIGDLVYLPVATTGNLMRFIEAGYAGFVDKAIKSRKAFRIYGILIVVFAAGAVAGAFATITWHVHAILLPAALLAFTLALFVVDGRKGKEP